MERRIIGFFRDEQGDWVAEFDCGHTRHMRHDPPFHEREWVTREDGREARLDTAVDCRACGRREMPEGHAPYKRTATFDRDSVPKGLLGRHTTKAGVWARIEVLAGRLRYRIYEPFRDEQWLDSGHPGIVLPQVEHDVTPEADTRFYVEFYRKGEA